MLRTTVGQLLVNRLLPADLRNYGRTLDKKGLRDLLRQVADKYPEKYREITHQLLQIGRESAYRTGGMSFGLRHLVQPVSIQQELQALGHKINRIQQDTRMSDKQKQEATINAADALMPILSDLSYDESIATDSPLGEQVKSGTRGGKSNLRSLLAADLLYVDHRERPIPLPILKSYSQGLSPAEFWASTYGARKGLIDVKFATQEAGALSKQLNQVTHRLLVTKLDGPDGDKEPDIPRGLPADTADPDNEGMLLARAAGSYKRNTILTPKIINDLTQQGVKKLLIRSPVVGGPSDGGVYARDVGIREKGILPPIGDWVGLSATQALTEPLSQAQLSSKHSGGVAGAAKGVSGFKYVKQMTQVPKKFPGGATHAKIDGRIDKIEEAPAGGTNVYISGEKHYIPPDFKLTIKQGDVVEAGDVVSDGIPNPYEIVHHKGLGEGRRYFMNAFQKAYADMGMVAKRKNVALLARGLINHVRMTDEYDHFLPDDVIPYNTVEHAYRPRPGFVQTDPSHALGKYLERPALHYTIGTRIRPSVAKELKEFGVSNVAVHTDPPPFISEMVRAVDNLQYDPDWMTRMLGQRLERNVLSGIHRGAVSDESSTSYVPSLAKGTGFGRTGLTQGWKTKGVL